MEEKLKDYSENLEKKINEKTRQLEESYQSRNTFLSSILFSLNKISIEKQDVRLQADLMFETFDTLFSLTGIEFKKSNEPYEAVVQARDWLVKNYFLKKGQMQIEKAEDNSLSFHLTSTCPFVEEGRMSKEKGIKIHCLLGLLLLYFIKKTTGSFGFVVSTKKFDEKGCHISLKPVFGL